MRKSALAATLLLLVASAGIAKERRRTELEKQQEKIHSLKRKLARQAAAASQSEEQKFLQARAAALLERLKPSEQERYRFDRLSRAVHELLEASEEIQEAREPEKRQGTGDREEASRALQRHYFRVRQAEYFAALCGEADAAAYVKHSRALYQQGRSAYDAGQYRRARKLGEAASLVVSALEHLAQAKLSAAEPPPLP